MSSTLSTTKKRGIGVFKTPIATLYNLAAGEIAFILLSLLICAARLTIQTRPVDRFSWPITYEAIAHIVVGILFGLWLGTQRRSYLWMAIGVTFFEVICFLLISTREPPLVFPRLG